MLAHKPFAHDLLKLHRTGGVPTYMNTFLSEENLQGAQNAMSYESISEILFLEMTGQRPIVPAGNYVRKNFTAKASVLVLTGDCDVRINHIGVKRFLTSAVGYEKFSNDAEAQERVVCAAETASKMRIFSDSTSATHPSVTEHNLTQSTV